MSLRQQRRMPSNNVWTHTGCDFGIVCFWTPHLPRSNEHALVMHRWFTFQAILPSSVPPLFVAHTEDIYDLPLLRRHRKCENTAQISDGFRNKKSKYMINDHLKMRRKRFHYAIHRYSLFLWIFFIIFISVDRQNKIWARLQLKRRAKRNKPKANVAEYFISVTSKSKYRIQSNPFFVNMFSM